MRIAIDPGPYRHLPLLQIPDRVARVGFEFLHLVNEEILPGYRYPKWDRELASQFTKALLDAGVTVPALLALQRISWPDDEEVRTDAVRNFARTIQVAVDLGIPAINTEFSGRPEKSERSEAAFYRSMQDILPIVEREGLRLNFDAHPDDFVEDGLQAWQTIRALDNDAVGFVYVAAHTFHYGDRATSLLPLVGDRLAAVYAADAFDHRRSGGCDTSPTRRVTPSASTSTYGSGPATSTGPSCSPCWRRPATSTDRTP